MAVKVVFVDDEPDLCDVYENLFSGDKATVKAFTQCDEALRFINLHTPDFIFIDYRMPQMSGVEFRKRITTASACYLITGELEMDIPDGFVDVVRKPLREDEFLRLISR